MDCSQPGSSVHGISPGKNTGVEKKKRILDWVAISFSRGYSQPRDRTWVPCIGRFFTTEPPGKPSEHFTRIISFPQNNPRRLLC